MNKLISGFALVAALMNLTALAAPAHVAPFVEGDVLVRFKGHVTETQAAKLIDSQQFEVVKALIPDLSLYLVKTVGRLSVPQAVHVLSANENVRYAQANHRVKMRSTTPNDPQFKSQWNLENLSNHADIDAPGAWAIGTGGKDRGGKDLVVAVVDGGVDTSHADLKDNIWVNPGEIAANKIDDDGNGFVDDVYGWNAYNNSGSIPAYGHGTHVAGIVGARGNNGKQVSGVNWDVKIMAVAAASGETATIAVGYGYVLAQKKLWLSSGGKKGANIVSTNSSFGVDYGDCKSGDFPVWNDLYNEMGKVGILSAAATINSGIDVDVNGDVPTGCTSDYIVSVTNTTNQDEKNSGAGFGLKSIDLGAPGTDVLSTYPGNQTQTMTGTSMATPHVAGSIAFLHSVASDKFYALTQSSPAEAALALKGIMLQNVDQIPALKGRTVSGGRLSLSKSAQAISQY